MRYLYGMRRYGQWSAPRRNHHRPRFYRAVVPGVVASHGSWWQVNTRDDRAEYRAMRRRRARIRARDDDRIMRADRS